MTERAIEAIGLGKTFEMPVRDGGLQAAARSLIRGAPVVSSHPAGRRARRRGRARGCSSPSGDHRFTHALLLPPATRPSEVPEAPGDDRRHVLVEQVEHVLGAAVERVAAAIRDGLDLDRRRTGGRAERTLDRSIDV